MQTIQQTKKIAVLGRVSPPYGGVTVHLDRLLDRLRKEAIPYVFYDLAGRRKPEHNILPASSNPLRLLSQLGSKNHICVHFHASNPQQFFLAGLLQYFWRRPIVFSLHGEGILNHCHSGNWLYRKLLPVILRRADHLFPINPACVEQLVMLGVSRKRITWMAAYLPPSLNDMAFELPKPLKTFLQAHQPVIATQGFFGSFLQGKHVYRFDLIGQMLARCREQYPRLGVVTMISQTSCPQFREEILALRREWKLESSWFFQEMPIPAVKVYQQSDVFLRPTETDGDSVSIRECLDMGIPVLASNAVSRPAGCVLFEQGELNSLCCVLLDMFHHLDYHRTRVRDKKTKDQAEPLLRYYKSLLKSLLC